MLHKQIKTLKVILKKTWHLPDFRQHFARIQTTKTACLAVETLIQSSRLHFKFFVMCGLSGILATLGILLNDTAILIAAMVLAPLLNPVLAFAAGISLLNRRLIFYAASSFFGSVLFVIFISALFVKIILVFGETIEISAFYKKFQDHNLYFLITAFVSGFAGVYTWLRPTNQQNLVGVAIAVSLIPFVSFFGILLGINDLHRLEAFLLVFSLNLLLIIAGATLAFLLLGFRRVKNEIDSEVVRQQD